MYAIVHEEMLNSIDHLDDETQGLVLLAYTKYLLYGVEPSTDNQLVYSLFKAKQFDLDYSRNRAEIARENWKKWGRPRKDFTVQNLQKTKETQSKPNDNPTETQKNQEQRTKNKEQIKENIKRKFGEYVSLSETEYTKLTWLYGEKVINSYIEKLNYWIGEKPTKDRLNRKSYFTLLNRLKRSEEKGEVKKITQIKQETSKIENLRDNDIYLNNLFQWNK